MPEKYKPLPHWHGNLLCAIDLETTGIDLATSEVVQIAIVPLGQDLRPAPNLDPFVSYVQPESGSDPDAALVHGIPEEVLALAPSRSRVIDRLIKWVNSLGLVFDRRLMMLAHNGCFENRFLNKFLGTDLYNQIFNANSRDSMFLAIGINDLAVAQGKQPPFERVNMSWLCNHFNITNPKAHDAYFDALACAELYRKLLQMDVLL